MMLSGEWQPRELPELPLHLLGPSKPRPKALKATEMQKHSIRVKELEEQHHRQRQVQAIIEAVKKREGTSC